MCPPVAAAPVVAGATMSGGAIAAAGGISAAAAAAQAAAIAAAAVPATGFLGLTSAQMMLGQLGLSALTQGFSVVSQSAAAKAQAKSQQEFADAQRRNADLAFAESFNAESEAFTQKDAADSQRLVENAKAAAQARATAVTSAGEAGVGGSVDALLADFSRQEAVFSDSVKLNAEFRGVGFKNRVANNALTRDARITNSAPTGVARPNYLGAALRVAGGAFDAYNTFSTRDAAGNRTLSN